MAKEGVCAGRPTAIGKNFFIGRTVSDFEGEASVEKIRLFALLHPYGRVHTATSPVSPNRLLAEKSATGIGNNVCHAVDKVQPRKIQKGIIEDRLFGDNAQNADVPYFAEPFICS